MDLTGLPTSENVVDMRVPRVPLNSPATYFAGGGLATAAPLLASALMGKPSLAGALSKVGMAGGFTAGNALAAMSDVADRPRRYLWGALGLPEHGNELVGNLTGDMIHRDSTGGRILGNVAEMALDPLNLAMMGFGGLAGRIFGAGLDAAGTTAKTAALADKLANYGSLASLAAVPGAMASYTGKEGPRRSTASLPGYPNSTIEMQTTDPADIPGTTEWMEERKRRGEW